MPNPLHRNRVLQDLRRFLGNASASFLESRPAPVEQPGQTIDELVNNISLPECTVGLAGTTGNPDDFNLILERWMAGGATRAQLNPVALMRLWAAIYRTYGDWVSQVGRSYVITEETVLEVESSLVDPRNYSVTFKALDGDHSIRYNPDAADDEDPYILTGNLVPSSRDGSTSTGALDAEGNVNNKYIAVHSGASVTSHLDIFPDFYLQDGGVWPFFVGGIVYGGPVEMLINFDTVVDVEAIRMGIPCYGHNSNAPGGPWNSIGGSGMPFSWPHLMDMRIRSSSDGIVYDRRLNCGTQAANTTGSSYEITPTGSSNLINVWRQSYVFDTQQTPNLIQEVLQYGASLAGGTTLSLENFPDRSTIIPAPPTQANYDLWDWNDAGLSNFWFDVRDNGTQLPSAITIPTQKVVMIKYIPTGVYYEITIQASLIPTSNKFVNNESAGAGWYWIDSNEDVSQLDNILEPIKTANVSILALYTDTRANPTGTAWSYIWGAGWNVGTKDYLSNLKTLSITSGWNDLENNLDLRPYFVGFPLCTGVARRSVITLDDQYVLNNVDSTVIETDPYFTNNSPIEFVFSGSTFTDKTAEQAYIKAGVSLASENNKYLWKILPYTLPYTSTRLQSDIQNSLLLNNLPQVGFQYDEDYISNEIIPFPLEDDLAVIEAEAAQQGRTPQEYYLTGKLNELLNDLIQHCRSTCLRFWTNDDNINNQVRNYRTYSDNVVRRNNLNIEVPLSSGPGGRSSIRIYDIPGDADVRVQGPASWLWFLSGGTASRIDIDTAVLLRLQELAGLIQ